MTVDKIRFHHSKPSDQLELINVSSLLPRRIFVMVDRKKDDVVKFDRRRVLDRSDWVVYKQKVWLLTEQVAHLIPGIEKRGFKDHHIDHIISIWKGFKIGLCEYKIADITNLRMLPYKDNMRKGIR